MRRAIIAASFFYCIVGKSIVPTRIFVDAGHGGMDAGARGVSPLAEKEICLKLGKLVEQQLNATQRRGKTPLLVKMSRQDDRFLKLTERVGAANKWGADLFVSIHANSSSVAKAKGFEVYFLSAESTDAAARKLADMENDEEKEVTGNVLKILTDLQATLHVEESSRFAESVHRAMVRKFKANGQGVRQGPFSVLSGTTMPAVLIEIGYLTNPIEAHLLNKQSYLKELAGAISSGIVEYLSLQRKVS